MCAIESIWERTIKQARSVPLSAIRSVLESKSGSILENWLRVYFGASWEHTWECKSSRLGGCHRVYLGASLRECQGVYMRTCLEVSLGVCSECTWECLQSFLGTVSQAGLECKIECNQQCTSEHNWKRAMKCSCQFYWMQHDVKYQAPIITCVS